METAVEPLNLGRTGRLPRSPPGEEVLGRGRLRQAQATVFSKVGQRRQDAGPAGQEEAVAVWGAAEQVVPRPVGKGGPRLGRCTCGSRPRSHGGGRA